ncbi:hypothetical protein F7725_013964 [Dissostichus mawsoni]|uniref:Ran-GTPase activating protein 1 C-terminal domain-containing protein n=1 Tax=Dissostichus mawsoni TaxID=36200 RepID=A0A7J5YV06_DISMA|nr:hypothetical protein F7725_013964 [Dissostichus mawsoni]
MISFSIGHHILSMFLHNSTHLSCGRAQLGGQILSQVAHLSVLEEEAQREAPLSKNKFSPVDVQALQQLVGDDEGLSLSVAGDTDPLTVLLGRLTTVPISKATIALVQQTHVGDGELSFKGLGLKLDDAQSVEELVRDIEQFQGLRALRLEGNTVGVEAARAIAKALENKDQLQRCYWSDMFTGRLRSEIPTALRSLGSALMTAGARLTELDLSDNAFGPDGVKGVEQLLKSPSCHSLKELRLNNCGVGIGGGKVRLKSLAHGSPLRLRVFIAGRNRLENEGASALAKAFQLMGSLEEVHMPQNGINHAGVMALASAMRHNPDLRALRHLRNVQVINFGDCLVRSEGAIALAAVLREGLPVLKEINLSFGEITEAAALVVAQAVRDKPDMEKVDLNGRDHVLPQLPLSREAASARRDEDKRAATGEVHASDPHTAAEILLKISSLYSEEPETKTAVLETIDAVLKKLLSGSDLSSYCFSPRCSNSEALQSCSSASERLSSTLEKKCH